MTRFTVPIKNILGNSYYRYRIYSSHYNTTSNTTITITCEVKDVFRRPMVNQLIFLYHQNESIDSTTTDSNGVATWTISNLEAGLHNFQAGSATMSIRISGWKTVSVTGATSYATLYVNESERLCELRYVRTFSSASADTFYEWHSGAIPSKYRPSSQVMGSMNQVGGIYVDSDGDIGGKFANGFSSNRSVIGTVMWHY